MPEAFSLSACGGLLESCRIKWCARLFECILCVRAFALGEALSLLGMIHVGPKELSQPIVVAVERVGKLGRCLSSGVARGRDGSAEERGHSFFFEKQKVLGV